MTHLGGLGLKIPRLRLQFAVHLVPDAALVSGHLTQDPEVPGEDQLVRNLSRRVVGKLGLGVVSPLCVPIEIVLLMAASV